MSGAGYHSELQMPKGEGWKSTQFTFYKRKKEEGGGVNISISDL